MGGALGIFGYSIDNKVEFFVYYIQWGKVVGDSGFNNICRRAGILLEAVGFHGLGGGCCVHFGSRVRLEEYLDRFDFFFEGFYTRL